MDLLELLIYSTLQMAQSTVLDILTIMMTMRIVGGASLLPIEAESSSTLQHLNWKVIQVVPMIAWNCSMDSAITPVVCQKAVVAVSPHQSIQPVTTCTCNSSLILPAQEGALRLTTGDLVIHQVRFLNSRQSNLCKDTKRADISVSIGRRLENSTKKICALTG